MDWKAIWNDIVNFFKTNAWNIVIFFAVLLIGIIVIKIFMNVLRRVLKRTKLEPIAVGFICGVIKLVLYLCLVLVLLSIIGIEITGILTAVSALLLAVGLALENNIANAANGIIVVSSKMFKKGDYIEVEGKEGNVVEINFLFTTILTSDNKRITIPNSSIVNGTVVNYDSSKTRRVDFKFNVGYDSNVKQVEKIIKDVMYSNGQVLLDPEPFCRLNALNSNCLEFSAKCWCDSVDYWDVYYYVLENVFNELKRNNITMPTGQVEVRQRKEAPVYPFESEALPKRIEKVREESDAIDLEKMSFSEIIHHQKRKNSKRFKKNKKDKLSIGENTSLKDDKAGEDNSKSIDEIKQEQTSENQDLKVEDKANENQKEVDTTIEQKTSDQPTEKKSKRKKK